ncbi:olfactory receptor 11A1-like isoform X2 [Poecilia reticulata]|uniref:olfactory receptor 11A1-like isoform X2 n=1 Tax=Poecilia reticulata TaxID=8081 RepID=UPI0007E98525|nr:PREDICTED: olfactory receptor 11A1-like isoform X2 [Poecilia reticulata]
MTNSSQVLYFTLTAYFDIGGLKYLYFMMVMCFYVLIVGSNVLLIAVICVNRSLHEPMFLFLCSLFVNELFGSLGLFPFLLVQILSDVHRVSAPLCFLQIFCVYSYAAVEVLNLAVMSYDRYVAICFPLQYNSTMTDRKVALLIALTWALPVLATVVLVSLSAPLRLCGNVIDKVFCGNFSIVKLSCSNTSVNNVYGLVLTVVSIVAPLVLILYTYGKILEILQSRFDLSRVPPLLAIVLSLYFLTCQPLFNPALYGLKMAAIRDACKRLLCGENAAAAAASPA